MRQIINYTWLQSKPQGNISYNERKVREPLPIFKFGEKYVNCVKIFNPYFFFEGLT